MASQKRRESRVRTKQVRIGQVMATRIQAATVEVFERFDTDTLDLDMLSYFVLQHFALSVENFNEIYCAVKDYIIANFAVSQGDLRRKEDTSLRHTLIHYVKPLEGKRYSSRPPKS